MMISGYVRTPLNLIERAIFGILAVILILALFGTIGKIVSLGAFALLLAWTLRTWLSGTAKPAVAGQ